MTTRKLALELLRQQPALSAGELARAAGVSRQAAHRHLRQLVDAGALVRSGAGRGARYLTPRRSVELERECSASDAVSLYRSAVAELPPLGFIPPRARELLEHALVELVDNTLTHSGSDTVRVVVSLATDRVRLEVSDRGAGAFECVQRALGLETPFDAMLAFGKGPMTRDPDHHRGEALWFVAQTVDQFELSANGLVFRMAHRRGESGFERRATGVGTHVRAEIDLDTDRRLRDALAEVTLEHAFARTKLAVRLFSVGSRLVSRSEAQRLLAGLERLSEVVLDFSGVEWVSQSFADEVFRIWARDHPTRLYPAHMNDDVSFVVRRALMPRGPAL